ncbi:peptidase M14 [candidate division KSB1 bacterium]|nr:peptidase M14 [candidate division KSB1 bacterium]RQW03105.1 MAG: peptidase M14 [candidate division KSB1 bacterium]
MLNVIKEYVVLKFHLFAILILNISMGMAAELTKSALKAMGAPNNPHVEVAWNRYYDHAGIRDICERLEKAHPDLIQLGSIGKSVQGLDIYILTVTNLKKGTADRKPAMYIDGNIHSNEIQGSEVALYTAWYLVENYGHVDWITELLDKKTFYVVPTINPDARDYYIHQGNTPHSPRSGLLPRDDDGDGLVDEDPMDDLDGDGHIVRMRRRNPNGRWKVDPDDPRMMIQADPDEKGDYDYLGWEGIDNDDDGRVNEDGPGFYDPNRNWGWRWQPSYVQYGSDQYPFSIPENRAVADFVLAHPNIGGAQSYHNSGGMILRGPGTEDDSSYSSNDQRVYENIGKLGEQMLPEYKYMVLWKDLYSVYGGELDWFYGARGIYTFTNELWTSFDYFRHVDDDAEWFGRQKEVYRFDELLLFGEGIISWKKIEHPQYGEIEIGGVKKSWTRTAPSFLLEDMCHRNMAFTLFHAYHLPLVSIDSVSVTSLGAGLSQVDVLIVNNRMIPTRSDHEINNKFTRPDWITLEDANVVAGFVVTNPLLNLTVEQKYKPERININCVPPMASVYVRWLITGTPRGSIVYDSAKGGLLRYTF